MRLHDFHRPLEILAHQRPSIAFGDHVSKVRAGGPANRGGTSPETGASRSCSFVARPVHVLAVLPNARVEAPGGVAVATLPTTPGRGRSPTVV